MEVKLVSGFDREDEVRQLFCEYTAIIIKARPELEAYLGLQSYEQELRDLRWKYSPPGGRLYIALSDGRTAGCIALHRLDERRCELKRLYVRQDFRGQGIARKMVERIISEARREGYGELLLDTVPELREAIALYYSCGFTAAERYNDSPIGDTVFLRFAL